MPKNYPGSSGRSYLREGKVRGKRVKPSPVPMEIKLSEIKKYPKKIRGGGILMVDEQIARWRKKLKKLGLTTGKHQKKDREIKSRYNEKKKREAAIIEGKINFFGVDEE